MEKEDFTYYIDGRNVSREFTEEMFGRELLDHLRGSDGMRAFGYDSAFATTPAGCRYIVRVESNKPVEGMPLSDYDIRFGAMRAAMLY